MKEEQSWSQIQIDAPMIDVCMVAAEGEACGSKECQDIPRRYEQEPRLFGRQRLYSDSTLEGLIATESALLGAAALREV